LGFRIDKVKLKGGGKISGQKIKLELGNGKLKGIRGNQRELKKGRWVGN